MLKFSENSNPYFEDMKNDLFSCKQMSKEKLMWQFALEKQFYKELQDT